MSLGRAGSWSGLLATIIVGGQSGLMVGSDQAGDQRPGGLWCAARLWRASRWLVANQRPPWSLVDCSLTASSQAGWSLVGCLPTASSPAGWPPTTDPRHRPVTRLALMTDPRPVSSCRGRCHRRVTLFAVGGQPTGGHCWPTSSLIEPTSLSLAGGELRVSFAGLSSPHYCHVNL